MSEGTGVPPHVRFDQPGDGNMPVWSGRGLPPAVGSIVRCNDKPRTRVKITGYEVQHGWLMALGERVDEPGRKGDLAGTEILYPLEG